MINDYIWRTQSSSRLLSDIYVTVTWDGFGSILLLPRVGANTRVMVAIPVYCWSWRKETWYVIQCEVKLCTMSAILWCTVQYDLVGHNFVLQICSRRTTRSVVTWGNLWDFWLGMMWFIQPSGQYFSDTLIWKKGCQVNPLNPFPKHVLMISTPSQIFV